MWNRLKNQAFTEDLFMPDSEQEPRTEIWPGAEPVSTKGIIGVAVYLVFLTIILFLGLYLFWPRCTVLQHPHVTTAVQRDVAKEPTDTPQGAVTPAPRDASSAAQADVEPIDEATTSSDLATEPTIAAEPVKIFSVWPATTSINSRVLVMIKGAGFQPGANVTFGGFPGRVLEPIAPDSLSVEAPPHPPGTVAVSVRNPDGSSDVLPSAFQFTCPPVSDAHLLFLVVMVGGLGGTIHSLRSLYWYVGNRTLRWSWVPMYILLPFSGAAVATVFYLIIRGGFLSTTPDRESSLVVIAVAALAGLFSQEAVLKLKDIANAVLTKPEPGADSKPQRTLPANGSADRPTGPVLASINPTKGPVAGGTLVRITAPGITSVKEVTFGDSPALDVTFDLATAIVTAKSPPHAAGEVDVVVTDRSETKVVFKYHYQPPA